MQYMLLIYGAENSWTPEERIECMKESMEVCDDLDRAGKFITASPLESVTTAATVRVREGKALVTTGPFAETAEHLGGYYLIDVPHLDEAIAIACRLPPAKVGTVEIRPVFSLEGMPEPKYLDHRTKGHGKKKFMFLCYDDEATWKQLGDEALQRAMQEAVQLTQRLHSEGKFLSASPLHAAATATSVRVRNGQRIISDGPYAETREVLGGFYIITADSLEDALSYAEHHPGARVTGVEVRPIFDTADLS